MSDPRRVLDARKAHELSRERCITEYIGTFDSLATARQDICMQLAIRKQLCRIWSVNCNLFRICHSPRDGLMTRGVVVAPGIEVYYFWGWRAIAPLLPFLPFLLSLSLLSPSHILSLSSLSFPLSPASLSSSITSLSLPSLLPPLFLPPLPLSPPYLIPSPSPPCRETAPLKPARGSGECCKLP